MPPASKTALYRLYGSDGRLLYVGISDQLGRRWEEHLRSKPWWPKVQRMTSEWHADRPAAVLAEIAAIEAERPVYNVKHAKDPMAAITAEDVEQLLTAVRQMKLALTRFEKSLGVQPRKAADAAPAGPTGLAEEEKLMRDLGRVVVEDRVRVSELPLLLRSHDPEWVPYRRLTGRAIAQLLRARGVRLTNTGNVLRLDPEDLGRVVVGEAEEIRSGRTD
jgi:predicted GIY-YIG superfamily endonuclease